MKIALPIIVLLTVATVVLAAPMKKTLTLRFQPPAEAIANTDQCGVTEAEVSKAVKSLQKALRKEGVEVQLGTFTKAEGAGKLWINGKPLDTWLKDPDLCRVTADQIVEAGMSAADRLINGTKSPESKASRSATRTIPVVSTSN